MIAGHGESVEPAHWLTTDSLMGRGCSRDAERESGDIGQSRARLSVMWGKSQLREIIKIKQ